MGVFVNTMAKTLLVGVSGTHWLYKNGNKWSYNIAIRDRGDWMARGAAVGKP